MLTSTIRQTWCVTAVLLNMLNHGMILSFPSSLLPSLLSRESEITTDMNVASWIASCIGISGIPGFLVTSLLMDLNGRRLAHVIVIVPGIIGWLVIYFALDIQFLIIGRLLCGFTASATLSLGAVMIGEYSSPENRGMFLNLKTTAVSLGGMVVHILGNFFTWRTIALFAVLPYIIALVMTFTWPESPAWLALRKLFDESKEAFYWLREENADSANELKELLSAQEKKSNTLSKSLLSKLYGFFKKFTQRDFLKPLIILIVCGLLLETSGRHIFSAYALQIIERVTGDKSQSFYYTFGIDLIISVSTLFASILVKIFKRRFLLLVSSFAAIFVLLSVSLYLYLDAYNLITKGTNWIAIMLFLLYFILVNLGCAPISIALLGEIFPLAHRGVGSGVAGCMLSTYVMIGMKVTPYLLDGIKVYGMFAVFGALMGVSLVILYFILPETKDRTLQEIEDFFNFGTLKQKQKRDKKVEVFVTAL